MSWKCTGSSFEQPGLVKGVSALREVKHLLRCFVLLLYCGWRYYYQCWTLCVRVHITGVNCHILSVEKYETWLCRAINVHDLREFSWRWYEPGYLEMGKVNALLWCSELSIIAADIMHQCNAVIFHSFRPNPFFILSGFESTRFWQSLFVTPSEASCRAPQMWISPTVEWETAGLHPYGVLLNMIRHGWKPGIRAWVNLMLPYQVERNHINIFYVLMSCMLWRAI